MADPRDLIQRLIAAVKESDDWIMYPETLPVVAEAEAWLATPEPAAGPTDDDFREDWSMGTVDGSFCFASSIISRLVGGEQNDSDLQWLAAYLRANCIPAPIPLSDRLPGPEDCDGDCCIWLWVPDLNGHVGLGHWELLHGDWASDVDGDATHWLPHHALPLPTPE